MKVNGWRIARSEPKGLVMWFDPDREVPGIRPLTDKERSVRLDMLSSVSALDEDEDTLVNQRSLFPEGIPHGSSKTV